MYRFGVNGGKRLAWFPSSSGYVTGSIQMKAGLAQGLSWQASANAEPDRCVCVYQVSPQFYRVCGHCLPERPLQCTYKFDKSRCHSAVIFISSLK